MSAEPAQEPEHVPTAAVGDFWRDGFVVLRGVIAAATLERLVAAVARVSQDGSCSDMTAMAADLGVASGGDRESQSSGAFIAGVDHWREDPDLAWYATDSELPRIVASVLRSSCLWLYEDSVLVKQPHTRERTHWHQDGAYFQVAGEQICTTWCPLDSVTEDSGGLTYSVRSHHSGELYRPNLFVSDEPLPGTEGEVIPERLPGPTRTVGLEPGDILIHHARTLHAAGGNHTDRQRRAVSVRYCGDDVRYRTRPGTPLKPHHSTVTDGDVLGGPDCPQVWPSG